MQKEQEKFLDFVMQSVVTGKEAEVKALLAQSFADVDTDNYSADKAAKFKADLLPLIQADRQKEIELVLDQFKTSL